MTKQGMYWLRILQHNQRRMDALDIERAALASKAIEIAKVIETAKQGVAVEVAKSDDIQAEDTI